MPAQRFPRPKFRSSEQRYRVNKMAPPLAHEVNNPVAAALVQPARIDQPPKFLEQAATLIHLQEIHGNTHVARLLRDRGSGFPSSESRDAEFVQRRLLNRGDRGPDVRALQEQLNAADPKPDPSLSVDGNYGSRTRAAVIAFQNRHELTPDGIVGPLTLGALQGRPMTTGNNGAQPSAVGLGSESPTTAPDSAAVAGGTGTTASTPEVKPGAGPQPEPPKTDLSKIAAGIEDLVESALDKLKTQPDEGALAPNFIEQHLSTFFDEFAAIPVIVRGPMDNPLAQPRTVRVKTPYLINVGEKSSALSKEVFAAAEAARQAPAVRAFFRHIGREKELGGWHALHGKATPENIQSILQEALDDGLIEPQDETRPSGDDLETWLRTHGVGVDCSGFVSQALNRVLARTRAASGQEGPSPEIRLGSGSLKGGAKGFDRVGTGGGCEGPRCLQPADTMFIPGHIRIVTSVAERDGGVEFSTAESRAGGRERVGMDMGHWFYPDANAFKGLKMRRHQDEPWRNVRERPTFGRYNALTKASNENKT